MKQGQQGDVTYERVREIPNGAQKKKRVHAKGHILAEGEATNHFHAIADECELFEHEGTLYLKNEKEVTLNHEEHGAQVIEPGIWKIGRVSEYDYFSEAERNVAD